MARHTAFNDLSALGFSADGNRTQLAQYKQSLGSCGQFCVVNIFLRKSAHDEKTDWFFGTGSKATLHVRQGVQIHSI